VADLDEIVRSAVGVGGIESAAVFVISPGSAELQLGAAAGVDGVALDRLVAAVADPAHPIRRSMADDGPTFDVRPMNPGGPALRSHLPLPVERDGRIDTVGVLAVAHDDPLDPAGRARLIDLARTAALAVAGG
jgi:hypothetical protein